MLKLLFVALLVVIQHLNSVSQVIINVQIPPNGVVIKSQLWNLSLVNTSREELDVQMEMILTDLSTKQKILSGTSKVFRLSKGAKKLQINDIMPIRYTVYAMGYGLDINPNGYLPVGNFSACYTVIKINPETSERMAEECESFDVEPLSPPILVSPSDKEEVDIARPQFSWLPTAPVILFKELWYDLVLVEIQEKQTGDEAIQRNIPILSSSFLPTTTYQYPVSAPELDASKTYAWQIAAKSKASPIAKSEVWIFKVKKPSSEGKADSEPGFYVKLRRENDASYVVNDGLVRYEYLNEINDESVKLKVLDITDGKRQEIKLDPSYTSVKFGRNYLRLDLRENNEIKNKRIYLLILTNSKNEDWHLKFECRKSSQK